MTSPFGLPKKKTIVLDIKCNSSSQIMNFSSSTTVSEALDIVLKLNTKVIGDFFLTRTGIWLQPTRVLDTLHLSNFVSKMKINHQTLFLMGIFFSIY